MRLIHACFLLAIATLGAGSFLTEQRDRQKLQKNGQKMFDRSNLTTIKRVIKVKGETGNIAASPTIIGGELATPGQIPWQAGLILDDRYFCGGSLISSQWVMTAAHCARDFFKFMVFLGTVDLDDAENRFVYFSSCKVVHEYYNGNSLNNDIALVRLPDKVSQEAFDTGTVGTICLPTAEQAMKMRFVDEPVQVSGWGLIEDFEFSPLLRFTSLTVMSNAECADFYSDYDRLIIHNTLCTYPSDTTSGCYGDSGGALVWTDPDGKKVQIGIVSFGPWECLGGPNGFTRVTGYVYWIHKHTGIHIKGMSHSIPSDTSSDSSSSGRHRMDTNHVRADEFNDF